MEEDVGVMVHGWMKDAERAQLNHLARGRLVLELGTYQGLSTFEMCKVAKHVHSVDWHRGDEGTGPADTLVTLWDHMTQLGIHDRLTLHVGRFEKVLPLFKDHIFDLVFIDGAHDAASVKQDVTLATRLVRNGGILAFHDWHLGSVREGSGMMKEPTGLVETLAWFEV